MSAVHYEGEGAGVGEVYVVTDTRREPLPLRLDLRNHSPTGFAWGYGGSGPAQLALALLANTVGDEEALAWYQPFKWRMVATLPRDRGWKMTPAEILDALKVLKAEGRRTQ